MISHEVKCKNKRMGRIKKFLIANLHIHEINELHERSTTTEKKV